MEDRHRALFDTPDVFLDITINDIPQDRIEIYLYRNEVPLAAENFRILCTNETPAVSFKGSIFDHIIPGYVCQCGNNLKNPDDTRFVGSIYGDEFLDVEMSGWRHRAFDLMTVHRVPEVPTKHAGPYPYACGSGSRFFICVGTAPGLDDGHVVFGTVVKGRSTVLKMSDAGSFSGIPTQVVKVVACGQVW